MNEQSTSYSLVLELRILHDLICQNVPCTAIHEKSDIMEFRMRKCQVLINLAENNRQLFAYSVALQHFPANACWDCYALQDFPLWNHQRQSLGRIAHGRCHCVREVQRSQWAALSYSPQHRYTVLQYKGDDARARQLMITVVSSDRDVTKRRHIASTRE